MLALTASVLSCQDATLVPLSGFTIPSSILYRFWCLTPPFWVFYWTEWYIFLKITYLLKFPSVARFFSFFSNKVANRCGPAQAHSCNSGTWEWSVLRWCDPLRHKQQSSHACQEPIIIAIFYGKLLHFSRILHNLFMHKKILLSGYWCRIHFPYRVSRTRLRGAWTGWDSPCTRSHTHRTV